ncbi:hypothetical protein [Rodentibacter trehalosifermentans]|uniref:Uncharacterized protein n=1 Tax=Rodentibacter trehalosifermentans TaxID=1908263 RepID=A0A1V3IT03_9PAST|nr:hypothetical protein [Rodentibacter trehalosifermentans]OOF45064.1 hypothetical protein BKK51_07490 [Rodentibacter trehalosifermentans]OOF46427.1 hypothetical protein BKK52_11480 [Rodentibacter trehalosifermentans]OOF52346.1 hypothetical protein BKK53_05790 [Rodentibacter trehalosifermentans]
MKKLAYILFMLLPFMATTALAAPSHKNTPTKQTVQQTKKSQGQKTVNKKSTEKKIIEKNTKKNKAENKKSVSKAEKNKGKKQTSKNKKSTELQKQKTAQKAIKKSENKKTVQNEPEKAQKQNTLKTTPLSQAKKTVVVPKCQDNQVTRVLSDAFNRQGKVTKTPMTVKNLSRLHETQHYPQQGIRSCYALVETNGKKYQTNYSVILNDNGFFVQVENAQPTF